MFAGKELLAVPGAVGSSAPNCPTWPPRRMGYRTVNPPPPPPLMAYSADRGKWQRQQVNANRG